MNGRIKHEGEPTRLGFPLIGKIKIGKLSDKGYPMSVDYFIPTGKYEKLFTKAYGERPQTIQVIFPSDDPEKVCSERYEYRDRTGALVAYGDGETFMCWNGKQYAEVSILEYPNLKEGIAKRYPQGKGQGWTITLTLTFIMPLVRGIAGAWTLTTKGVASSIPTIRDTFDAMKEKRGFIKGVIFDLSVKFAKSNKPGVKSKYPVITLCANESEENVNKIKEAIKPIKELR